MQKIHHKYNEIPDIRQKLYFKNLTEIKISNLKQIDTEKNYSYIFYLSYIIMNFSFNIYVYILCLLTFKVFIFADLMERKVNRLAQKILQLKKSLCIKNIFVILINSASNRKIYVKNLGGIKISDGKIIATDATY